MCMDKVKISIIVPVYNAEKYLQECMESILSQTYKNIEVICVDDGSSDKSAEIIKSFQKADSRIKLIQQTNQYAGTARNNGFAMASGEYAIFLDADDYFHPLLVEKMVLAIHEKNADISICESQGFDDQSKQEHKLAGSLNLNLVPEKEVFSKQDIPEQIFQLTSGWAWDKMYRAGFLRDKNLQFQNIRAAEDELFVDLAFGEAEAITVVKEVLVTHRTNVVSSLEYRKDQFWYCGYEMLSAEKEELEKRGLLQMLKRSFVNRAAGYIAWYACSIKTPDFFTEFYSFYKEKAIRELEIFGYPHDFYFDSFTYGIINKIMKCTEKEFLCESIRELNQTVMDRDAYVQELLEEIQKAYQDMQYLVERMKWMQAGKRWVFPKHFVPDGARFILYGFGDVGSDWYDDIRRQDHAELVMVVDRNYRKFGKDSVKIHPVEDIDTAEYDYILIAINEKKTVESVKVSLIRRGVLPEKLLWLDPSERAEK